MDKYEYKLKTEQMLELMNEGAYDKAAEVADTIDWRRVRNVTMLSNVSDIYDKNHDYKKSYEILTIAYHRAEGSRKIISRLCTLALKTRNVDEAIDYYDDFVQVAPKDPNRFLLRYQILRAQRAPIEQQIEALEHFKKSEYIEEWAYELAKLYNAAGMVSECLQECDDLILWFSEGKYVYQAMELKMKHKPLTPSQQEKYDNRYEKLSGETAEMPNLSQYTEEGKTKQEKQSEERPIKEQKEDKEENPDEREVEEPEEVKSEKPKKKIGNTMKLDEALKALLHIGEPAKTEEEVPEEADEDQDENLEELEDAIQEIESIADLGLAKEIKEDLKKRQFTKVDSDLEELKVENFEIEEEALEEQIYEEDVPEEEILQEVEDYKEEVLEEEVYEEEVPEEEIYEEEVPEEEAYEEELLEEETYEEEVPEEEIYEEEAPEEEAYEEELLEEEVYEEEVSEEEIYEEEASEEEVYEEEVLEEEIYEEEFPEEEVYEEELPEEELLEEEVEEFEENVEEEIEEVLEEKEKSKKKNAEPILPPDIQRLIDEIEGVVPVSEETEEEEIVEVFEESNKGLATEELRLDDIFAELNDDEDEYEEEYDEYEEAYVDDEDEYEEEYDEYEEEYVDDEDEYEENVDEYVIEEDEAKQLEEEFEDFEELEEEEEDEETEEDWEDDREIPDEDEEIDILSATTPLSRKETAKLHATGKTAPIPLDELSDALSLSGTGFVVHGRYDLKMQSGIGTRAGLTEEQKKLFSYFVPVRGMSEQLVDVLEQDKNCTNRKGTSCTGNLVVIGNKGNGKTVLAVDVVKAIQKQRKIRQGKVAIVTGEALNQKKIGDIVHKLYGGALIIEKAGKMNERTVSRLNKAMEHDTGELLIVLEDQRKPLDRLLSSNREFRRKFTSRLEVPIFINDELVTFGQTYAQENGYRIDEMGILALYSRIDMLQREDHAVTVSEVKEVMDEAIARSQKASAKKLMKRVFGRNTDSEDRIILGEKDFNI